MPSALPASMTPSFDAIASSTLTFWLNGVKIELDGNTIDPDTTLLSFIRSQPNLTGTKLGCGEGGCGACTVCVQSIEPLTGRVQHLAINACLAPLVSVEGKHVITVEALGDSDNPHPLQERMWKLSGSQCGFCTPGIIMSVYCLLREAAYKGALAVEDVELKGVLDGNLCRCTGYAPIFQAVKSFVGQYLAPKANIPDGSPSTLKLDTLVVPFNFFSSGITQEDAPTACCGNPDGCGKISTDVALPVPSELEAGSKAPIDPLGGATGRTAPISPSAQDPSSSALVHPPASSTVEHSKPKGCGRADCCQLGGSGGKKEVSAPTAAFPRFDFKPYRPGTELILPPALRKHSPRPLKFGNAERTWYRPTTLAQLIELRAALPESKLIGGSSEVQIEVGIKGAAYAASIYIAEIPELGGFELPQMDSDEPVFRFGANFNLSGLEKVVSDLVEELPREVSGRLKAVKEQLRYFAGLQIRNAASVGGNIATASPISDLNPVWVACGAVLTVVSPSNSLTPYRLGMTDFFTGYRQTALPRDAIILSVELPLFKPKEDGEREVVRAYKQAKRRDDDIAIVTSCMRIRVRADGKVKEAKIAFGGMAPYTITAKQTESFLRDQPTTSATLNTALDLLASEFALPYTVPGGMPSYRRTLVLSFFFKFFVEVASQMGVQLDGIRTRDVKEVTEPIHRALSSATRDNSTPYAQDIVGTQVPHVSGLKHSTGEAIYVDDMPSYANEAYLALVLSTKAHAKLLSVDPSAALELPGVISYIDANDLPSEKANVWGSAAQDEHFFAPGVVTCHGQIIGAIVAKTKLQAQKAARAVKVEYEELPRVLTIEEAIAANSFHEMYDRRMVRLEKGDSISEALAASEYMLEGTTRMGGQEHHYLETMTALAVPKLESGEMELFASTQALTDTQRWVAQVTGVPRNRIVARSKRLGGGFGGKETRTAMLSAVCAVAAKKLRRPIRCALDRDVDIKTSGQRHPFLVNWKVGFTKEGKITALDADFYANGGYSLDISGGVADRAIAHATNSYFVPNVDVRAKIAKTHTVSNTAYRGFGGPQGMLVAENYVEAIATHLQLDIDEVRRINLFKGDIDETHYFQKMKDFHVPRLLEECAANAEYERRKKEVEVFNKEHRYRKRGIALLPTTFGLAFGVRAMNQGSALVSIYMDGSVLVAHGGTEMGQGLYTKCLQIAAEELKVPLEAVHTAESATNTVPNTVPTAASAGSDLNGYAVLNACRELNTRLAPYREKLGPEASLSALAAAAWGDRVLLSATGFHATPNLGYVWNVQERTGDLFHYYTQGAACSEVELDVLTGDHTVLRTDIVMDVGRSINPAIDYGQVEGAFLQGYGWGTLEESLWLQSGAMFTTGPGAYKLPGFADIPQQLNVKLLRDAEWPNLGSVHSSKGVGEPPFFLGMCPSFALRHALKSAREDAGYEKTDIQEFRFPLTSERLRMAAGDHLAKKGAVNPREGEEGKGFFVYI
ncbi:hypothetical protein JCM10213v2_007086 [Rhodosporidiobolus nylandii]